MKKFFLLLLIIFSSTQAQEKKSPIDVLSYDLELSIDVDRKTVAGVQKISFAVKEKNLSEIKFDAYNIGVNLVTERGKPLNFSSDKETLVIKADSFYSANTIHSITVHYTAKPDRGIKFSPDQIYTSYHTSHWMPCNFHPGDKAKFSLRLEIPSDFKYVGNGETFVNRSKAVRYVKWQQEQGIPAYAMGFAIGRFNEQKRIFSGKEISALYNGYSDNEIEKIFSRIGEVKNFFEEKSGVKYPQKKYSYVFVQGNAAQEASNFCLLSDKYPGEILEEPRENWLLIHELSHEWWGNGITCSGWENFWLNEGFAQFMTAAAKEKIFGRDEYDRDIWLSRRRYEKYREDGKGRPLEYKNPVGESQSGGALVYNKGTLVLHLLRELLGEENFWKGMKIYSKENFGKNVSGENLRAAMEKTSGRNLKEFFDDYVYGEKFIQLYPKKFYPDDELLVMAKYGENLFVRIDALETLKKNSSQSADRELKEKFLSAIIESAEKDPSRLVRQVAKSMLENKTDK